MALFGSFGKFLGDASKSSQSSQADIPAMGQQEQDIVKYLQSLGMDQGGAVKLAIQMASQGGSPNTVALNTTDQAALDQAYSGAEQNLLRHANMLSQQLAGTRGLNTSDTPVASAVSQEFMPAMANLQSAKAQQGLGLGLSLAQLGQQNRQFNIQALLQGTQATPSALSGLANRFQSERFAQAKQTQTMNPSFLQGMQGLLGIGGQIGAMGMGMAGAMPGGGLGLAANSGAQDMFSLNPANFGRG